MFERECRREKIIESKMKEMRLKTKVGRVIDTHIAMKDTTKTNLVVNLDQVYIQQAEKEFFAIIEEVSIIRFILHREYNSIILRHYVCNFINSFSSSSIQNALTLQR